MMIRELLVTVSFLSIPAAAVVVFGGAAAQFLATGTPERESAAARPAAAPDPADAFAAHCAACHGAGAQGGAASQGGAPGLLGPWPIPEAEAGPAARAFVAARHERLDWSAPAPAALDAALLRLSDLRGRAGG